MITLREWLAAEPFTLTMSSGFFGFFAHTGVVLALEEQGLLPVRTAGSSAGALVAGAWSAGVSAGGLAAELSALERSHFWDPGFGLGVLRGRLFRELLDRILPVPTFAQCRVPVAISAFDVWSRSTIVLESGALAPAIHASCAVPLMFHPVWHRGRPLLDGGVLDRPGLAGVAPGARVLYHHLTSRMPSAGARELLKREAPLRSGLTALLLESLPQADPFHLDQGKRALELAARATRDALDRPIEDGAVRVVCG